MYNENVRFPPSRSSRNYVNNTLPKCYDAPPKPTQIKETKMNKNGYRRFYVTGAGVYRGWWKDNERHGLGIHSNKLKGETFEGEFQNNKRSPYGVLSRVKPNGIQDLIYEGEFADGSPNGQGELHTDTYQYKGKVIDGKPSGVGIAWFNDGTIYFGTWFHGRRMGQGMLIYPNRNRYEGNWYNDKKHGTGLYCFFNRGQALEGVWVADLMIRGVMRNIKYRQAATSPVVLPIPKLELKDYPSCYYIWKKEALAEVGKYVRKEVGIDRPKEKDSQLEINFATKPEGKHRIAKESDLVNTILKTKLHISHIQVQPCFLFE